MLPVFVQTFVDRGDCNTLNTRDIVAIGQLSDSLVVTYNIYLLHGHGEKSFAAHYDHSSSLLQFSRVPEVFMYFDDSSVCVAEGRFIFANVSDGMLRSRLVYYYKGVSVELSQKSTFTFRGLSGWLLNNKRRTLHPSSVGRKQRAIIFYHLFAARMFPISVIYGLLALLPAALNHCGISIPRSPRQDERGREATIKAQHESRFDSIESNRDFTFL